MIRLARRGKQVFVRWKIHRLLAPLNPVLMRLSFMTKLGRWQEHHAHAQRDAEAPEQRRAKRYELYEFLLASEHLDAAIDYLEFGVGRGNSLTWWVRNNRHPSSQFVGFDTFTGLPEPWGGFERGAFSTGGQPPDVQDERCRFEKGLFQDTLGGFLKTYTSERRKVIHLDADLYSATLFVLTRLAPILRSGDLLLFDEFGVPTGEFRAFSDFVSAYRLQYDVLGAVNNYLQVAIKVR